MFGRWARVLGLVIVLSAACAASSATALSLSDFRGHLGVGYVKLVVDSAPGGSMSVAGGIDWPITSGLRMGVDAGFDLLGTRTVQSDSTTLVAELDYSMFETLVLAHWLPAWKGPLERVSLGAGFFSPRADLTSSAAPAFDRLAVEQAAAGLGFGLTLMQRKIAPVRLGFEFSGRYVFLPVDDWKVVSGRLTVHY